MVLELEAISLKSKNQEVAEEYTKNINVRKTKAAAEFTSLLSWR